MKNTNKAEEIESLQSLRAVAAILVLLFHMTLLMQMVGYPYANNYFMFGNAGVDIFFVLSGFIIYYTSIHKKDTLTSKEFLFKRFLRIFPIYWIATIATLMIFLVGKKIFNVAPQNVEYFTCGYIQEGGIKSFLKSLLLLPNQCPIVIVSWTLRFEIIFYVLFGLFFFYKPRLLFLVLFLWVAFCLINTFYIHIQFGLFNPIVSEFLFGCIIAAIFLKFPSKYWALLIILGASFFLISVFFAIKNTIIGNNPQLSIIVFGVPAAIIIYGFAHIRSNNYYLLNYLGDASYSIYLFHFPILAAIIKTFMMLSIDNYLGNVFGASLVCLITLSICCFIYKYIENPLLSYSRKKIQKFI